MQTLIVKKTITGLRHPWWVQYTINGWGNPAGEVYDLKNGQFLALANSHSTGYSRKVFKSSKSAENWIEKKLRQEYPNETIKIEIAL